MSLATQVSALATRVATEIKTVRSEISTLASSKANTSHTHAEYAQKIHIGTTPPADTSLVWVDTSGL